MRVFSKYFSCVILLVLSGVAFGVKAQAPSWFLSGKDTSQKWAIVPSPSYNDTYGTMGTIRAFIYPTLPVGYYTAISATLSEKHMLETEFIYQQWRENGDRWQASAIYNDFSDPYYGEGHFSKVEDLTYIPAHKLGAHVEYTFKLADFLYNSVFLALQYRQEKQSKPLFATEATLFTGLELFYDSRDNVFNPSSGEYYSLKSWVLADVNTPIFLEGNIRLFVSPLKSVVLAGQAKMGLSVLTSPSYVFRFNLGGPDTLRGFRINRFRGAVYYLYQAELRWSPVSFLTFAGFVDLGVADDKALQFFPHISYGAGIRVGMPHNNDQKIRIEWGFGEDQSNFIVTFFHPF